MENKQEAILHLLKTHDIISGENIAGKLSISRTAVWKHIKQLQHQGYVITATPNKGYMLKKSPDTPFSQEIREGLKTKCMGKKVHFFPTISSTNNKAKHYAKNGGSEGTIVISEIQTAGRGRKDRMWSSPKGGLWFSIILRPSLPPQKAMLVTMTASLALSEAIKKTIGLKTEIKWPNDLLIAGKKVCGILTELSAEMDQINYMIIGIGLNVNNQIPEELQPKSVSLKSSAHRHISRVCLLRSILHSFDQWYQILMRGDEETIKNTWLSVSQIIGKQVMITDEHTTITGVVKGIDPQGCLRIKTAEGEQQIITGDVHYI